MLLCTLHFLPVSYFLLLKYSDTFYPHLQKKHLKTQFYFNFYLTRTLSSSTCLFLQKKPKITFTTRPVIAQHTSDLFFHCGNLILGRVTRLMDILGRPSDLQTLSILRAI